MITLYRPLFPRIKAGGSDGLTNVVFDNLAMVSVQCIHSWVAAIYKELRSVRKYRLGGQATTVHFLNGLLFAFASPQCSKLSAESPVQPRHTRFVPHQG